MKPYICSLCIHGISDILMWCDHPFHRTWYRTSHMDKHHRTSMAYHALYLSIVSIAYSSSKFQNENLNTNTLNVSFSIIRKNLIQSSWNFSQRSVPWFLRVCVIRFWSLSHIFNYTWHRSPSFAYRLFGKQVDWPINYSCLRISMRACSCIRVFVFKFSFWNFEELYARFKTCGPD